MTSRWISGVLSELTARQKKTLARILAGGILLIALAFLPLPGPWRLAAYLIPYAVVGWDVLFKAGRNIANGQVFDENFLMALATVGAFLTGEYPEGVFVMLFYQVGELFQGYAVGKSRRSISALMDIRPDSANVERNGQMEEVDPDEVEIGEVIVVRPGEKVPLDGVVLEGASSLDTRALTGESLPRDVGPGEGITSGCVNLSGLLRIKVARPFEESTVSKILDLVENSSAKKARSEQFITRFARWYTPCVVIAAALLALLPPLILGGGWADWIHRALIFLVISCPCALVISVPLSFFGGIGGASRQGILVKGGNHLEDLAKAQTMVFDKTGTLTRGIFQVTGVYPQGYEREELLEMAALAEAHSNHPISQSLRQACRKAVDMGRLAQAEELSGRGVRARVDGRLVCAGNARLMEECGIAVASASEADGTTVHVAVDDKYAGRIVISDELRQDAAPALRALREQGIQHIVMLTGDAQAACDRAARALGVDEAHAQLMPGQKVAEVERLMGERSGGRLAFVGDGINDAPVLSRADVGIAMGGIGSDAAIEAADIVLMDDAPVKIALAMRIARKTLRIVRENIVFALGVKAAVLVMGALGVATMWEAVFADVGVSVIAILNAMRALKTTDIQ